MRLRIRNFNPHSPRSIEWTGPDGEVRRISVPPEGGSVTLNGIDPYGFNEASLFRTIRNISDLSFEFLSDADEPESRGAPQLPPLPPEEYTRHPVHDILEELEEIEAEEDLTQMLDVEGHTTKDRLTALLYRLAKEHVGWAQLERTIDALLEVDAFVLQNEPMAKQAVRLASKMRFKK